MPILYTGVLPTMPHPEGYGRPLDFPEWLFPGVYTRNKSTGKLSWVQGILYEMGERMVYDPMVRWRVIHLEAIAEYNRLSVSRAYTDSPWRVFVHEHERVWEEGQYAPKDETLWLGLPWEEGPHPPIEESGPLRFNRVWLV